VWCNIWFAEILDLGKGVKIKIFDNHEYFEVPFEDYSKMTWKDVGVTTLNINQMIKDREGLGFVGAEKSMIIGNKGIRILGDAELIRLKGEDISNTKLARIRDECKRSAKLFYPNIGNPKNMADFAKCFYKGINGDPMFQITVADKKTDLFRFLNEALNQSLSKKEKDEIKKEFLLKNNKVLNSVNFTTALKLKLIIFDDHRWFLYTYGVQEYPGLKFKSYSLILQVLPERHHEFILTT
jgi:hypothetical protein